jgi:hypothetical protein
MDVITHAGFCVTKQYGDRKYVLRAPTFGEVGGLLEEGLGRLEPVPAVINERLREALTTAGHADKVAVIDAFEEAEDTLLALLETLDKDESKDQVVEANIAYRKAKRQRAVVEALVADDASLKAIRLDRERTSREQILATLALMLCGWEGPALPAFSASAITPDYINKTLPGCDVLALSEVARDLRSPSKVAEGNSAPPTP